LKILKKKEFNNLSRLKNNKNLDLSSSPAIRERKKIIKKDKSYNFKIQKENLKIIIPTITKRQTCNIKAKVGLKCGAANTTSSGNTFYNCEIDGENGYLRIGYKTSINNVPQYAFTVDKNGNITAQGKLVCDADSWVGNWHVENDYREENNQRILTNSGALIGYREKIDTQPSIKILPATACIAFFNNYQHKDKDNDYTFLGGSPSGNETTQKKCKQNFVCIYNNNKSYHYGKLRADSIYSEYGALTDNGLFLNCHNKDGKKYAEGTVYVNNDTQNGAVIITSAGIKKYINNKWWWQLKFNNQTDPA
jgi:hypothetical protein